jgi:hypothetical protein
MNGFMIFGICIFALTGIVVLVISCLPSPMVNKMMSRFKSKP